MLRAYAYAFSTKLLIVIFKTDTSILFIGLDLDYTSRRLMHVLTNNKKPTYSFTVLATDLTCSEAIASSVCYSHDTFLILSE